MAALVIICCSVLTVTGFNVGWVLADNHLFWNRQEWASRIEERF